jgi:hypothetical protein
MPAPIDKIGAKVIAPSTDVKPGAGPSRFRELQKEGAAASDPLPPLKEVGETERKTIERDLRKRLEAVKSQEPAKVFGPDMKDLRARIDAATPRVEGIGGEFRARLSAIESQFTAAQEKLKSIPDTNNLRELLAMQTEMYKCGQNLEILSKVVDAATSGIKQTLQTQV